ncbi:MAG: glycogen synthase, partial [Muriicola sp.]
FEGSLDKDLIKKVTFDGVPEEAVDLLKDPTYNNLLKIGVNYADAVILAAEGIPEDLLSHINNLQKPVLPYVPLQEFEEAYANFYNTEVLN